MSYRNTPFHLKKLGVVVAMTLSANLACAKEPVVNVHAAENRHRPASL